MSEPAADATLSETDRRYLRRCVELAREALQEGNKPYGSLLVDAQGKVLFEDRNATKDGDATRHPEFEIARWAAKNVPAEERPRCTVYTSGEHCAMCSAAHAWVDLGRIVYASSTAQRAAWYREWNIEPGPVADLSIQKVAPGLEVAGPDLTLADEIRELHARLLGIEWEPPGKDRPVG